MTKKITFISYTLAIFGLLAEALAVLNINGGKHAMEFSNLKSFLRCVNIDFFGLGTFPFLQLNVFNTLFFLLLFIGAIQFSVMEGKKTKLLQFLFSIVLIKNFTYVIDYIYFLALVKEYNYHWWTTIFIIKDIILVYVSYFVLNNINPIKRKIANTDNDQIVDYIHASKWQRFFHFFVDTLLCLLLLTGFVLGLAPKFWINSDLGDLTTISLIYIISSLIYFPFFEYILGATPAKFFTQTIVVNENGEKPSFKSIVIRTLSRLIPFDGYSFFFTQGWHDIISKTQVIRLDTELNDELTNSENY
ncbi:MAG: RDD family protein [Chitinophagales bacterium]|nr:RDD family protein [Chitinophagales bacterium]